MIEQRIIYIIFNPLMEAQKLTANIIVLALDNPSNKRLSQTVIKFLDTHDIETISRVLEKSQNQNSFSQLIRTHYFLLNYLNKVDRTFYYSFYEEDQFRNIQNAHTALLANNYSYCFLQFPKQYQACLLFIQKLFPQDINPTELTTEIQRMITDTDIPMPKLKRENQGIFCKTSFQNYLIYLKFKNQWFTDYEQVFEMLDTYLEGKEQIYLQKLFMKAAKDKALSKKVRFLRFTPYEITYSNFQNYLVENNSLHNFLVAIFALTDVWLNSIRAYVANIEDPFHRYIELITRYSIYRNFVISIEQNLSFVFERYNDLYSQVFGKGKPMYRFWRPAMTKWMLKFEQYHSQCSSVFYYCLTKLRTEAALKYLQLKEQQNPDIYMTIKNKMSLREYDIEVNETLMPGKISNGVEDFFEKDKELYQVIIVEFLEYMVDLSINQETVHWCGHSEQILSQPYISFQKYVMAENKMYLNYIRDIVTDNYPRYIFQKEFLIQDIEFLQSVEFKPLTLKKIVQCYNLELSETDTILYDCKPNDETLRYFNMKADIKYLIPEQQMYFYSITPLATADELLTKSISTAYDSSMEEEESDCEMQYFSQSSSVEGYGNQNQLKDFDQQHLKCGKKFIEDTNFEYSSQLEKQIILKTNSSSEQPGIKKSISKTSETAHKKGGKGLKKNNITLIKLTQSTQLVKKLQKKIEIETEHKGLEVSTSVEESQIFNSSGLGTK